MGVVPPYSYNTPSRQRPTDPCYDFDPKAVTRASWSTIVTEKPKQTGPFINFNKHPDSYVIVPHSSCVDLPPLSPSTRKKVVATRWVQFGLRIAQLVIALGLLVCVTCLRGIDDSISWVLRIPPAWDAAICIYAIIHLSRPAKARTPLSSSSYHTFSLIMDIALIPLMVVNAFYSEKNWSMTTGADGRWRSFFSDRGTNILLLVTWITAIALGTLHLISVGLDAYLIVVFRKIAHYPPDANPLEDSSTTRVASKHKHKNSEITATTSEMKHPNISGSTLAINRLTSEQARDQSVSEANAHSVPFYQSRTNLDTSYSAQTQETDVISRIDTRQQPNSARTSFADVGENAPRSQSRYRDQKHAQSRSHSRPRSHAGSPGSFVSQDRHSYLRISQHEPVPARPLSYLSGDDRPSRYSTPLPGPQASIPANTARLQQNDSLLSDNWCVIPDDAQGDLSYPRRAPQASSCEAEYDHNNDYRHLCAAAMSQSTEEELEELLPPRYPTPPVPPRSPARLRTDTASTADNGAFYFSDMPSNGVPRLDAYGNSHPPSLRSLEDNADANSAHNSEGTIGRALTISSAISAVSSIYSQDSTPKRVLSRASSPKRKEYGDLASATRSIRGFSPPPSASPAQQNSLAPPGIDKRGKSRSRERSRDGDRSKKGLQRGHIERGGRVISRTGVDLADASVMYMDGSSQRTRGRQASGKAAEEGRAGQRSGWWGNGAVGVRRREFSGTA